MSGDSLYSWCVCGDLLDFFFHICLYNVADDTAAAWYTGVYYGVCLIVLTFNIVFSVYVLNLSYRGDRGYQVPDWVRSVIPVEHDNKGMRLSALCSCLCNLHLQSKSVYTGFAYNRLALSRSDGVKVSLMPPRLAGS